MLREGSEEVGRGSLIPCSWYFSVVVRSTRGLFLVLWDVEDAFSVLSRWIGVGLYAPFRPGEVCLVGEGGIGRV